VISGRQLEKAGLIDLFERRFSVDETVKRHKPAKEAYEFVATVLDESPANICLIACHVWDTLQSAATAKATLLSPWISWVSGWPGSRLDWLRPICRGLRHLVRAGPQADPHGGDVSAVTGGSRRAGATRGGPPDTVPQFPPLPDHGVRFIPIPLASRSSCARSVHISMNKAPWSGLSAHHTSRAGNATT
jgi:hypothetical protein